MWPVVPGVSRSRRSRLIRAAAHASEGLVPFLRLGNVPFRGCTALCSSLSIYGDLGRFHFLASVKSAVWMSRYLCSFESLCTHFWVLRTKRLKRLRPNGGSADLLNKGFSFARTP